jgi:flagellar biosynthesis/type III secretory pathway M-ring protein FliF/YscJ
MAEVHVDVSQAPKKGALPTRTVRWFDRALLGVVMGIAAWVIERAVIRGTRRTEDEREEKLDRKVAPD